MNNYKNIPRLCGGTFFTILLQAVKYEDNKGKRISNSSLLSNLSNLIKSINIKTNSNLKSTNTSNYRLCKTNGGRSFAFQDKTYLREFDKSVKTDYISKMHEMYKIVDNFIDPTKYKSLVFMLIDLINSDETISSETKFYIYKNGTTATKSELIQQTDIYLPAFLLGVFHFAVSNVDNRVGKETIESWCPKDDCDSCNHSVRKFTHECNEQIIYKLNVECSLPDIETPYKHDTHGYNIKNTNKSDNPIKNIKIKDFSLDEIDWADYNELKSDIRLILLKIRRNNTFDFSPFNNEIFNMYVNFKDKWELNVRYIDNSNLKKYVLAFLDLINKLYTFTINQNPYGIISDGKNHLYIADNKIPFNQESREVFFIYKDQLLDLYGELRKTKFKKI